MKQRWKCKKLPHMVALVLFIACGNDSGSTTSTQGNTDPTSSVTINDKIVSRHNLYRKLVFDGSPLVWDTILATNAQNWVNFLAGQYTKSEYDTFTSPHANAYKTGEHTYEGHGEGENIAWSSNSRGYLTDDPIDIDSVDVANNHVGGSIDYWASEKAYYDHDTNGKKSGYGSKDIGHYTQIVWKNTTHVGCAKANSSSDLGGEWVVCRYSPPGNFIGQKPY